MRKCGAFAVLCIAVGFGCTEADIAMPPDNGDPDDPPTKLVEERITIFFDRSEKFVTVDTPVVELGIFELPHHESEEVTVVVLAELSGDVDGQRDESFGLTVGNKHVMPHWSDCPVVADEPDREGELWLEVGQVDFPGGIRKRVTAYHAFHPLLRRCYKPRDNFHGSNSVHFLAVQFIVMLRVPADP